MIITKIENINQLIQTKKIALLKDFDLSIKQAEILEYIFEHKYLEIFADEFIKELDIDKRLVSKTVNRLEQLEYIIRIENANDRRVKNIYLTEKALDIMENILAIDYQLEEEYFCYDDEQIQEIEKKLDNILSSLL